MATGHFPAASAASMRRRTHASFVTCVLFAAAWPLASPAQDLLSPLGEQARNTAPASGLAGLSRVLPKRSEATASTVHEPGELTLRDALSLALQRNPELAAFGKERSATEAALLQASALPNPVLDITGDNLRNTRKADAGDRTTTIQIGQLIEFGGKRAARMRAAEAGRGLANWDYEAKRIEILSLVAQRFVDVLTAQQRKGLADEALALARHVSDAAAKRVQAGKVSPVEETKARLAQADAEVELEQSFPKAEKQTLMTL